MAIYDLDYAQVVLNLLPVLKRKPIFVSWLVALCSPLQWLHDNFFNEYANGSNAALWFNLTFYNKGDRVVDSLDNGVYECQQDSLAGVRPSTANDPTKWQQVSANWIGANERVKMTGQKITLEYALNKWFRTTWVQPDSVDNPQGTRPDIYIDNNLPTNLAFVVFDNDTDSSDSYYYDSYQQNFVVDTYSFANAAWFTIWVPTAFLSSLNPYGIEKIKAIADKYVIAGVTYKIDVY